ncbi:dimer_Tnp_hAT domain-containing protein [Nephila pilipes]|uniref:Dimer_Tnp_hAT domain-containing protein n=1 Tax=Nephila pilipes TaxID=299642 RepID=A0A8X6QRZ0_NEPPI|nr:dimer_Tnp_hAT domain-containing protein [Nephila pilipes]
MNCCKTSRDARLTAKRETEKLLLRTIDRLNMEMNEKLICLYGTDVQFGFLLYIKGLCYSVDSDILKIKCENFSNFYNCDVDGQQLYEKLLYFTMLLGNRTNNEMSRPKETFKFSVPYRDEKVFPNLHIAIRILLTIAVSIVNKHEKTSIDKFDKQIVLRNINIKLELWDTAGHERFKAVYKGNNTSGPRHVDWQSCVSKMSDLS